MKFTPTAQFGFITDSSVRRIIEDYHGQAVLAYEAGAYIGTLVACGGVLEGVLAWALLSKGTTRIGKRSVEECFLPELIEAAVQHGLLGETAHASTWAVKEFRNFLHPYKLIREQTSARPNQSLALNSLSAVDEIVRSLCARLKLKEGAGEWMSDFPEDQSLLIADLNFAWIWPGRLAACRAPRSDDDISKLSTLGVRAIVRLEHFDIPTDSVQSAGIDDWLELIVDFGAPTQDQIERTVHFVLRAISGSKPTAVSCGAGYGRTATVLACVLIASGLGFEDALQELARSNTHRKPDTSQQRESIRLFAERVRKSEISFVPESE